MQKKTIPDYAKQRRKSIRNYILLSCSCFLCAVLTWPVAFFEVWDEELQVFSQQCLLGEELEISYTHSVEQTEQKEFISVLNGFFWPYKTISKSHNAGLGFAKPFPGSFTQEGELFMFYGGRSHYEKIYYRVGTELLGKNTFIFDKKEWPDFLQKYAGKRILFSLEEKTLGRRLLDYAHKNK